MPAEFLVLIVSTVFSVIGWSLKSKDEQQAQQIKLLFEKHDADAKELQDLRVKIAEKHYERNDVDGKIDKIERTVKDGFEGLGVKFDKLADALNAHLREGNRR
jgi:hypothetical protein